MLATAIAMWKTLWGILKAKWIAVEVGVPTKEQKICYFFFISEILLSFVIIEISLCIGLRE
jgi:hypothetical protein